MMSINVHLNKKDIVRVEGYAVEPGNHNRDNYVVFRIEAREEHPSAYNDVCFFVHNEEVNKQMIKSLQKAKNELKKLNEVNQEV